MDKQELTGARHLTIDQREDIAAGLQDATTGPISMTAPASDKEAVAYQGEIASVLEGAGCEVEIVNAKTTASVQEIPAGVEMTIKEETVRPVHASRIVRAFRRAGVVIATKINARRRQNDTLYISVGPGPGAVVLPAGAPDVPKWQWKSLATIFASRK